MASRQDASTGEIVADKEEKTNITGNDKQLAMRYIQDIHDAKDQRQPHRRHAVEAADKEAKGQRLDQGRQCDH